jgi:hypothetical protein
VHQGEPVRTQFTHHGTHQGTHQPNEAIGTDEDLMTIVNAWSDLPLILKSAILGLVRGASKP